MQNPPRSNSAWIWFFVVLAALSAVAVTALIRFNLSQQLQPEDVARARKLWREHGLSSYRLVYRVKRGEANADAIVVHVRNGQTELVTLNGRKVTGRNAFYGMDALLDDVEVFVSQDRKENAPRTFLRGVFDEKDGHLKLFVRRVTGSRERVEIVVEELQPLRQPPDT